MSDSDVVLDKNAPRNLLTVYEALLRSDPSFAAVGPVLRIDDLPRHYELRDAVIAWEDQFFR